MKTDNNEDSNNEGDNKPFYHNPEGLNTEGQRPFRLLTLREYHYITSPALSVQSRTDFVRSLQPLKVFSYARKQWVTTDGLDTFPNVPFPPNVSFLTSAPLNAMDGHYEKLKRRAFRENCYDFVRTFNVLAEEHHQRMVGKGFWDVEDTILQKLNGSEELQKAALAAFDGQKIGLEASELSEALEALRHDNPPDDKIPEFLGTEAEFADVLLRLMDHARRRGWRVAESLVAKMEMNDMREHKHGKGF